MGSGVAVALWLVLGGSLGNAKSHAFQSTEGALRTRGGHLRLWTHNGCDTPGEKRTKTDPAQR